MLGENGYAETQFETQTLGRGVCISDTPIDAIDLILQLKFIYN